MKVDDMYCTINYGSGVSLWVNNDCTECEVREGYGNLDKSERILTKAIALNKLDTEMCNNEYEASINILYRFGMYINAKLRYTERTNALRVAFTTKFDNTCYSAEYTALTELIIFHYFNSDKAFYTNGVVLFLVERFLNEWSKEYEKVIPDDWKQHIEFMP